jgi:hypothetical protein
VYRALPAALTAALALAATAAAAPPGPGSLPAGWSHAEINVIIRRVPHTLTYDRGRVQAVSTSSLLLRERDGSAVTVPLAASTSVTVDGRPGSVADILRGAIAMTLRLDGGPARQVRVHLTALSTRIARRG